MFTISSIYLSAYSTNVFHFVKELKDTPIITYNEFPFAGFTLYCEWSRNYIFFFKLANVFLEKLRSVIDDASVSALGHQASHLRFLHRSSSIHMEAANDLGYVQRFAPFVSHNYCISLLKNLFFRNWWGKLSLTSLSFCFRTSFVLSSISSLSSLSLSSSLS